MKTWVFEIDDMDSDLCGEEFLVEVESTQKTDAYKYAQALFPNVHLHCLGRVSTFEAEMMGLDTY